MREINEGLKMIENVVFVEDLIGDRFYSLGFLC
jgi:hypothetical protein